MFNVSISCIKYNVHHTDGLKSNEYNIVHLNKSYDYHWIWIRILLIDIHDMNIYFSIDDHIPG